MTDYDAQAFLNLYFEKGTPWCNKSWKTTDGFILRRKEEQTAYVRSSSPPPPSQKDWYFQTRCADFGRDLSHKRALRENVGTICELV